MTARTLLGAALLVMTLVPARVHGADADEIAAQQRAVDKHLLRVQQARFEADARGDDPRRLKRLQREFRRTQERRRDLARVAAQSAAAQ